MRVAPVVRTSSTRSTLRGAAPRGVDARRVPDPLGPAAADLPPAAAPLQAGLERRFEPLRQRRRQLAGRVEAAPPQPRRRRRHRHDRPAQHVGRRQPLDPLRHQVGDRQQPPELQRRDQVPRHPLVGSRGPGPVQPRRPFPSSGSAAASRRPQRVQTTASGRQDRPQARKAAAPEPGRDGVQNLHAPTLPSKSARVARNKANSSTPPGRNRQARRDDEAPAGCPLAAR